MEFLEGQSVRDRISGQPVSLPELLDLAVQIANALAAAHAKGIVHRDIKPANILLRPGDRSKSWISASAKRAVEPHVASARIASAGEGQTAITVTEITRPGSITGTLAYLSPEQALGEEVDARTDIYSFGVVLYEMATGRPTFRGKTSAELIGATLNESPVKASVLNAAVPAGLELTILEAVEKNPSARYQSAAELLADLEKIASSVRKKSRPTRIAVAVAALLLVVAGITTWWGLRISHVRWARNDALPRARLLAASNDVDPALDLLREAERYLGNDPEIEKLRRAYALPVVVQTAPPGADVYVKAYMAPDTPWQFVGRSPIPQLWADWKQAYRIRLVKKGFENIESLVAAQPSFRATLSKLGSAPPGMVFNFGGATRSGAILPDYWIDKYEVTNRQYKEFVSAGAYRNPKFWKQPFVKDERTLSFEEAMAEFRDATGCPGPAGWQFGAYPEGRDEFPVNGVSWYEAAAFAEFAGKSLPTTYQWYRASGSGSSYAFMAKLSNFGRNGPSRIGRYAGISPVGAYDMAGNVREWTWNAVGARRYILGGAWKDSGDMCMNPENRPPFDRAEVNGFRCIRSVAPVPEALLAPVDLTPANHAGVKPVSEEVFRAYRAMFSYDRTELKAAVEGVEEDTHWRTEKITFAAAYGSERAPAYLFLPKNSKPPFQTVVYCPTMGAFYVRDTQYMELRFVTFLLLSGRAVMYPIYKGTYDRGTGDFPGGGSAERDLMVQWRKDLGRAIDYLETRPDIDVNRLAFYGLSLGGFWGPVLTQVDQRFKASVLLAAGLSPWIPLPEIDAVHYLPRNHVPLSVRIFRERSFSFREPRAQLLTQACASNWFLNRGSK